ncbi:Aminomethyltransferase [Hibiscus syriacus]|uniref:Aminomethyltransferase n=1 Tax=Hibiscus syriacus TaxID=106335 RepID=A0A6A2XCA9_HIBSY|nr:Aminomethyltransferase [Hibiscus syriacus]
MRGSLWHLGQSVTRHLAQADKKAVARWFFASEADLRKTVLYDFHVANCGKMVPFAGWSMPIQYKGSIMDSTVNCRQNGELFDVYPICCRDKDLAHIEEHMKAFKSKGGDVSWNFLFSRVLLLPQFFTTDKDDPSKLYFGKFRILDINGATCFLTRTGYTGEDGIEISAPSENPLDLSKAIFEKSEGKVRLTGLGARNSLRLEAGLCVGFTSSGPPPRSHSEIQDEKGNNIGEITSGGFSPCLKKNIAMGYVKSGLHKAGTKAKILVEERPMMELSQKCHLYQQNITSHPKINLILQCSAPTYFALFPVIVFVLS